jgi:hypothetical protein
MNAITFDHAVIEKAVIEQAVDHLVREDELYEKVKRGIEARIDNLFASKVTTLIEERIASVVKEGFGREYTKRDGFGRPEGKPTSIAKELEATISGYWQQRVGRDGKPTESSYSSMSRAEWMMTQLCADDFSKEMKQHVVNVGGALKDHFREVLNQHIAVMLSDVFKVQSEGDRKRKNPGSSCISPPAGPIGS